MIKKFLIILFSAIVLSTPLFSAGNSSSEIKGQYQVTDSEARKISNYKLAKKKILKAKKLEKKGKTNKAKILYEEAYSRLIEANKENSINPDILNYMGFTSRKLGNFEDAEIYYLLGLDQDPKHIGINEYLGELYVETNRIDKAKERLKILEGCDCKEFDELQTSIKQGNSKY